MTKAKLLGRVADRYAALCRQYGTHGADRLSVVMSVDFANDDVPLDLQRLLEFEDHDFAHDVGGILRHIDHDTFELRDGFVPRCALRGAA